MLLPYLRPEAGNYSKAMPNAALFFHKHIGGAGSKLFLPISPSSRLLAGNNRHFAGESSTFSLVSGLDSPCVPAYNSAEAAVPSIK